MGRKDSRSEAASSHRHRCRRGRPGGCTLAGLATLAWLVLLAGAGQANPLDAFGLGARAIGLGGAFTGLADDFSASYYNPAGLAQGDELRLELGYLYSNPQLRFNGRDANVDLVKGFQGGVILPGEVLGLHFGASIGLFILDDRITRVRSLPQRQPRFVLFDNRTQRIFVNASLAIEPIEHLFVGGGLTFLANTGGQLDITGYANLINGLDSPLQASVEVDIQSTRYPSFGLLFRPSDRWSVGLAYRDEFYLALDLGTLVRGQIMLDVNPDRPIVLIEEAFFLMRSINATLYSPRQIVLGGSYDFGWLLVAADLGLYLWSGFPPPASQLTLDLDLGTLDFAVAQPDAIVDPGFSDLLIPRVGVEVPVHQGDHLGLVGRAGYFFEASPAPEQSGSTNYADSDKHGLSMGVGLSLERVTEVFPKPILLDLSFLYIRMVERRMLKEDPADLVGDYRIDGDFFNFSLLLGVLL
ncbi:MAG: hypothetical protein JW797_03930 [Bradymonadales bacterium]|nr:hypothetical protein [Bradymonadales bacterium]